MFNLTRYYSAISFLCIVAASAVLGFFYRHHSIESLVMMEEKRNDELTQVIGNALFPAFEYLIVNGRATQPTTPEVAAVRESVIALMQDTTVVKVKMYDMEGLTVFSTEVGQIGEDERNNPGFMAAAQGRVHSKITHRDTFSAFEGVIVSRDLIATCIPFRAGEGGDIRAVFEVYSDITPFMAQTARTQLQVVSIVVGVLGLLYGVLYVVVWRAKNIIRGQEIALKTTLARIEENNVMLDQRVTERTRQLLEANQTLQSEILERKRAEEGLRLSAKVFENALEGVIVTDAQTRILAVNQAFEKITGYGAQEVRGRTPAILQSGRHDPEFYAEMWQSLEVSGQWVGEIWNQRKGGEIYPERLTIAAVRDDSGNVGNYIGVFSDITDSKQSQERLNFLAHHDVLTGLPNRLLFNYRLSHSIELARRKRSRLAVLFVDLDHFKHVNDTLGHDLGDELLKQVAGILTAAIRKSDTLARIGGDEFILLLEEVELPRYAGAMAENILSLLCQPFTISNSNVFVSASIGISFFPMDGEDAVTLVKHADAAMYQAKSQGRNTYEFYASEIGEQARNRAHIASLLRCSIERGELRLCYQPQVDLATGELTGAEALVRWHSPELGLVSPDRFIPIAEDIGFISTLGEWVLYTACRQVVEWDALGFRLPKIGVNLSARQLERGDILDIVNRTLRETKLSPARLQLEITESAIICNEQYLALFERLEAIGLELAVDDFGTGYSSLGHLHRLPFQCLKIDRSFVTHVSGDSSRKAIVRAIIALANALGLSTVAEGVESDVDAGFLRQEGCRQAQGFLFGRPVTADELPAFASFFNPGRQSGSGM